jgi:hypothetical protein
MNPPAAPALPPPPAINFATEWQDEHGCVCPKAVDYATQCPKGHALVAFTDGGGDASAQSVMMCRVCHVITERNHASQWRVCSVAGCCSEYSVCQCCASALQQAPAAASGGDDLSLLARAFEHVYESYSWLSSRCAVQGVAVLYLLWLKTTLGALLGRLTVEQVCQMFIKPRTARSRGSVASELMLQADTSDYVGEATWFISHTWGNAFADTLDAILLFFEGRDDAATAKVWFDVLVDGQHAIAGPSKPSSWYMTTFRSNIARIGRLVLVADKWNDPTALRRAW